MPVPSCLGMDCGTPGREVLQRECHRSVSPIPERKSLYEQKSQHREGIEHILNTLAQQQLTLHSIVELQRDLQGLVLRQHHDLERQIAEYASCANAFVPPIDQGAGGYVDAPIAYTPSAEKAYGDAPEEEVPAAMETPQAPCEEVAQEESRRPSSRSRRGNEGQAQEHKKDLNRATTAIHGFLGDSHDLKKVEDEEEEKPAAVPAAVPWTLSDMVQNPLFDAVFGGLILLNFLAILIELEWKGHHSAYILDTAANPTSWYVAEDVFSLLSKFFNFCFIIELILRVSVLRMKWLRDYLNLFDAAIIIASCIDSFVLDIILPVEEDINSHQTANFFSLVRIVRVVRVLRLLLFLRVMRYMSMVAALRVLIKTITMSLDSLVWSMFVVGFIILLSAMLMVQLTAPFVTENSNAENEVLRRWVFDHYGSTGRASYTMFEATFSAKWATHLARPLIEDVSPWFSIFWVCYTVAVNFAVIRVIAALFLKQTMAVAAIDAERMAFERIRQKEKTMATLRNVFTMGDTSGDGELHRLEFEEMMENPQVLAMFEDLELEPHELHMLFELLSEDDGVADQEEFLLGAMKLKNTARTVDMIQVLHQQTVMKRYVEQLKDGLERIDSALHPNNPWKAFGGRRPSVTGAPPAESNS